MAPAVEEALSNYLSSLFPNYSVFIAGQSRTARISEDKPAIVVRLLSQRGEIHTIGATSYLRESEIEVSFYYLYRESNYASVLGQARSDVERLRMELLKNPSSLPGYLVSWVSSEDYSPTLRHPGVVQASLRLSLIGLDVKQ
jgi:hypothetical protein